MITLGWTLQHRSVAAFLAISLLFQGLNTCSAMVPAEKNEGAFIDFGKKFITDTLDLNYMTSQELAISIPGTEQELFINWGFGGSGHMLSPLPWVPAVLRSIKSKQATAFNFTDLGKAFLQDKVSKQAKQTSILKWLGDAQLSPLKLCSIKLFLLAKDIQQNNLDLATMQTEIARLLVRLSLTSDLGIIDPSVPFSACMPKVITQQVDKYLPGALSFMDSALKTLTIDKDFNPTDFESKLARTVYASSYTSKEAATIYFNDYKNDIPYFMRGNDYQFDGVTQAHTPPNMPEELKQAALEANNLPQLVMVQAADDRYWIGCVTDRLDITNTALLGCSALLATIKEYAAVRKTYLLKHPEEAFKIKARQDAAQQQCRRLHAFSKTDAGIISQERLTHALDALKNAPQSHAAQRKAEQDNADLQNLLQELKLLEVKEQKINNQLIMLAQSIQTAPAKTKIALQKRVAILEQNLVDVGVEIQEKEDLISALAPRTQTAEQTDKPGNLQEDFQTLQELNDLAAQLKKNGEAISPDITSMIHDLEAKIQAHKAEPINEISLDDRLEKRKEIAQIYRQEALLLNAEIAQRSATIKAIPQANKRRIDEIKFNTLEKPLFQAAIANLNQMADLIINQNDKMLDLHAYRQAMASMDHADLTAEERAEIRVLEFEVGLLLDNQTSDINNAASSRHGLIHALLYDNAEINEMLKDLSGDKKAYAPIKERLFNRLGMIIAKSDHVKDNVTTYGYVIAKIFPDFLPLFNHALDSATR